MSIGAITKVFATCPEEKSEYLVLIAMADQADDDGGNIWFKWETIAHKARIDERTAQMLVDKLIAKGRLSVEMGAAPRGYDLYHIHFPASPYSRAEFQRNREERRLEKRATGRTAYGKKRKDGGPEEGENTPSEKFSDSRPGTKNEEFSGNSEKFSEKAEKFSVGTPLPRPPSAAKVAPETSFKHPLKRGVLDITSNPREGLPPTPPALVVEPSPAQLTTTEIASLQNTLEAVREPAASVAVLPPDGGAADAAITDSELTLLFGSESQASAEPATPTEVQEVPPAGAGAAALAGPLAGLEVPHDPEASRVALQRALGGPRKLADLLEETPPGLREGSRHQWVSQIAPERIEELAKQGREQKTMHPWTAITQLLDQEIGAKIARGTGQGQQGGLSYSGSHAPARKAEAPDYSQDQGKYEPGARWLEKATGEVRVLAGLETGENKVAGAGARYKFEDGLAVPALTLMTKYEFQGVGQ